MRDRDKTEWVDSDPSGFSGVQRGYPSDGPLFFSLTKGITFTSTVACAFVSRSADSTDTIVPMALKTSPAGEYNGWAKLCCGAGSRLSSRLVAIPPCRSHSHSRRWAPAYRQLTRLDIKIAERACANSCDGYYASPAKGATAL